MEQFKGSFCPQLSSSRPSHGRPPLLPLWLPCHLSRRLMASLWPASTSPSLAAVSFPMTGLLFSLFGRRVTNQSLGKWWRGEDLREPSSSAAVEDELGALLSFPRQMAALGALLFQEEEHGVTRIKPNHWFLHEKLATLPSPW